ncbi:helix-turn-helix transcriptional regulator [Apibacter sp.]|uniref:helix-turn-helix domain-containing protein n=1 Tax=Apibacter sp. TaxID=2023709 RepID=UPI0025FB20C4|nr:helix-turn-helix transcriptional regulator [Apibacter sp.]MCT6868881.1 helix-turn-helix transcriptional regulator [Apibacter sp.]
MEIDKRISTLIEILGLTPGEFADKINVQRSSISHITSARNKPSLDFLERTLSVFPEINSEWLILGKGKPLKSQYKEIKKLDLEIENNNNQKLQSTPTLFHYEEENEVIKTVQENKIENSKVSENLSEKNFTDEDSSIKNSIQKTSGKKKKEIKKILIIYEDNTFEILEN